MKFSRQQLIEIIGIVGVVGSLLFVGLQLYFDRQVAMSAQFQNNAAEYKADIRAFLESDAYLTFMSERWKEGSRPPWWTEELENNIPQSWSELDMQVFLFSRIISLVDFENQYYQYQSGLLDESYWMQTRQELKLTLTNNTVEQRLHLNQARTEQYRALVELLVDEINNNQ